MAELTESALSQIVLPETMDDIEEYLKPQFPPKQKCRRFKEQDTGQGSEDQVQGRRIVIDGYGRWREIRPKKHIQDKRLELVNAETLPMMKQIFGMESYVSNPYDRKPSSHRSRYEAYKLFDKAHTRSSNNGVQQSPQQICSEDTSVYNKIGMMTRSNVFPGVGNYYWNTTTARTFTKKPVTAVENRKEFYGLQTDDFGVWAAANVLNERMKRAWGEYLETIPKAKANWEPSAETTKPKPPEQNKPIIKPKKNPPKPKSKQITTVTNTTPFQEMENLPNETRAPPKYVPDDDNVNDDGDFWDFYDKPFNKPQR